MLILLITGVIGGIGLSDLRDKNSSSPSGISTEYTPQTHTPEATPTYTNSQTDTPSESTNTPEYTQSESTNAPTPFYTVAPIGYSEFNFNRFRIPEKAKSVEAFEIYAEVSNCSACKRGGISISFPDNSAGVEIIDYSTDARQTKVYDAGSTISTKDHKNISAEYTLAEGYVLQWKNGESKFIRLKVTPRMVGTLRVLVRATLTTDDLSTHYNVPSGNEDMTDQQGFGTKCYSVDVTD